MHEGQEKNRVREMLIDDMEKKKKTNFHPGDH